MWILARKFKLVGNILDICSEAQKVIEIQLYCTCNRDNGIQIWLHEWFSKIEVKEVNAKEQDNFRERDAPMYASFH